MPKQIDYPRASMKNCLVLADAVNDLGGECSAAMAADKLNKQHTSGAYRGLIGAAVKYGVITNKKGQLEVTRLYRDFKLAYDEKEANLAKQKAFLNPPLFAAIFARFENKPLPVSHFEKLLIREFEVPNQYASRVSSYFLDGAKQCDLLGEGNVLSKAEVSDIADEIIGNGGNTEEPADEADNNTDTSQQPNPASPQKHDVRHPAEEEGKFSVRIKGPGMDSLIVVNEEEDLYIVHAMLKKVEKRLNIEDEWDDD